MTPLVEFFSDPGIRGPLLLTLRVCLVTVPLFLAAGIGLGYYLGRSRSLLASTVDFVVSVPMVFPPIATGFGLLLLLGSKSMVGRTLRELFEVEIVFGFWGVAVAAFVSGLPLMVKPVQAAVGGEVARFMEVSRVLGKTETETFFRVVLPLVRKNVLAGLFLAWTRSIGEVGVTLMLGGNIVGRTNTVSLEIYNSVFTGDYERAAMLALLLATVSLGAMFVLRRLSAG
ncbi:molybdate ABC transporter permease subunit [Desulfolutivibrio sulfoxidireducens]|uniref:molybdate ABC transporter permease subunit n=1 Tax=Desulfolutivibrio sulfoxidireducens TaxID=2773299 RepID=UPI00159D619F|nr:ABC transporter permease subunit [Desulfolutivibrio sulfoxidireducens]QLA16202.1 ABC transporter permease subunit [Desulfolutivibrio sulfoxidireducens]QLA19900.1 ABC transporter permease subunit [Desulfolutivibrio sulfoxidireducens]